MYLPDKEFDDLKELLLKMADKIEEFTPNVRGASDKTLLDAKFLVQEARRVAYRLGEIPNLTEYSYTRAEMIDHAIQHSRLLGVGSEYLWADYSKNLGLLIDFVDSKFRH